MSASMTTATLGRETSLSLFERMLAMRHFEEAVIRLYNDGRFVSHYHVYIGQEATGAGVLETLGDEDRICTTHRNHGHIVGRGSDPGRALAEILGRASGFNGGRSGTLHLCDPARGFLSTSGIVGGCAGLATGAAYGIKVRREPHVAVGFFGDGALEEGLVLESFNLAALWKLPVVYVCENNSAGAVGPQQGGYPTAVTAVESFTRLPAAYGIHTIKVDGADMAAVYSASRDAVQRCRAGNGPVFIEAVTLRWPGSSPLWPEQATTFDLDQAVESRADCRPACRLGTRPRPAAAGGVGDRGAAICDARPIEGARPSGARAHRRGCGVRDRKPAAGSGIRF